MTNVDTGAILILYNFYTTAVGKGNHYEQVQKNAPAAGVEDQTLENFEAVSHPKFEVYQDKAGEYRFRLKATNGQIIAVSEGYSAKASCLNGIESVQKNAPEAEIVEEA